MNSFMDKMSVLRGSHPPARPLVQTLQDNPICKVDNCSAFTLGDQREGFVGKGACHQASSPESSSPKTPHGERKEAISISSLLTFTHELWHVCVHLKTNTYMHTQNK